MSEEEAELRARIALRNRLTMATALWRQITEDPLPRMEPGDPNEQVEAFEMALVQKARDEATPDNAQRIAEGTWDLVNTRPAADQVRQQVEKLHAELAHLAHGQGS